MISGKNFWNRIKGKAEEGIYTEGHLCNYRGLKASAGSALDESRGRVDNIEGREEPKRWRHATQNLSPFTEHNTLFSFVYIQLSYLFS
jgi:hypothetical protein